MLISRHGKQRTSWKCLTDAKTKNICKPQGSVEKGQTNINYSQTRKKRQKLKMCSSSWFRWMVHSVSQSVSELMMIIIMMRLLIIIYACCHFIMNRPCSTEEKCKVTLQFRSILLSVNKYFKSCELHWTNFYLNYSKYYLYNKLYGKVLKARKEDSKSFPQCLLRVWVGLVAHRNRKDIAGSNTLGMYCKNSLFYVHVIVWVSPNKSSPQRKKNTSDVHKQTVCRTYCKCCLPPSRRIQAGLKL